MPGGVQRRRAVAASRQLMAAYRTQEGVCHRANRSCSRRGIGLGWCLVGGSNHEIDATAVDVGGACATRSSCHRVCRDATFTFRRRGVRRVLE